MIQSLFNDSPMSEYLYVHQIGTENFEILETREHIFECMTIHFIVSGKGYFNGEELHAGQGFVVNKNQLAVYGPDEEDPWVYYWINFEGIAAIDLLKQFDWDKQPSIFSTSKINEIHKLLNSTIFGDYSEKDLDTTFKSVLFTCFSYLLAEYNANQNIESKSMQEQHVTRALTYIKNNFSHRLCIEEIAHNENISRIYMSNLFKKYTNRSPQEHLIRMRIEKAKSLLLTTSIPISTIACSVGYEDVLQFSKLFKKHTGISPSSYRKGEEDIYKIYE